MLVVARRPHQHRARGRRRTSAARSWSCSRSASATTPRPTSTPRRASSPAGTWQLVGDRASDPIDSYYSSSTTPASTTPPRRNSPSRSIRTAAGPFPARPAAPGRCRTALDLIDALARHPATAHRLATRLYQFFVNERRTRRTQALITRAGRTPTWADNGSIKAMLRSGCSSPRQFLDPANCFRRYAWPVEFVVRAIKETGWNGLSVDAAITPLVEHGPAALRAARRERLGARRRVVLDGVDAVAHELRVDARRQPEVQPRARRAAVPAVARTRCSSTCWRASRRRASPATATTALLEYLRAGVTWTGSDAQLNTQVAGAVRLIVGAGEYQFN